jgi:hypothetical protein
MVRVLWILLVCLAFAQAKSLDGKPKQFVGQVLAGMGLKAGTCKGIKPEVKSWCARRTKDIAKTRQLWDNRSKAKGKAFRALPLGPWQKSKGVFVRIYSLGNDLVMVGIPEKSQLLMVFQTPKSFFKKPPT